MERQFETSTLSLKSVFPERKELTKPKQNFLPFLTPNLEDSTVSNLNQKGFKNFI